MAKASRWGTWYFAEYIIRTMRAFGLSMVIFAVGQPLMYLLALGVGLGALVARGAGTVDGVPYVVFVAPAILVATTVTSVTGEMTYPVMGGFVWRRIYYGPAAGPLTPQQIATGHLLAILLRFVVQALIFWLMALAFGSMPLATSILVVPIAVLTAAAFGAPLQAFAATRENEGASFASIQRFIVMPMFLFAGTFFPLDAIPVYLRWIGWISPVWHGTQLSRIVSYGAHESGLLVATHVVVLVVLALAGWLVARRMYVRRLVD